MSASATGWRRIWRAGARSTCRQAARQHLILFCEGKIQLRQQRKPSASGSAASHSAEASLSIVFRQRYRGQFVIRRFVLIPWSSRDGTTWSAYGPGAEWREYSFRLLRQLLGSDHGNRGKTPVGSGKFHWPPKIINRHPLADAKKRS